MKFLIVEDSRAMQAILGRIVSSVGGESEGAREGETALKRLAEHGAFDVALIDWNMPGMNGLQLVEVIRKDSRYSAMKIIMVTTETHQKRIKDALAAGADEYVMKPFTKEVLLDKLKLLGVVT